MAQTDERDVHAGPRGLSHTLSIAVTPARQEPASEDSLGSLRPKHDPVPPRITTILAKLKRKLLWNSSWRKTQGSWFSEVGVFVRVFFSLFFLGRGFFAGDGGGRSSNADYGFYGEVFRANGVDVSGISAAAGTWRQRKAGWHVACLLRT